MNAPNVLSRNLLPTDTNPVSENTKHLLTILLVMQYHYHYH